MESFGFDHYDISSHLYFNSLESRKEGEEVGSSQYEQFINSKNFFSCVPQITKKQFYLTYQTLKYDDGTFYKDYWVRRKILAIPKAFLTLTVIMPFNLFIEGGAVPIGAVGCTLGKILIYVFTKGLFHGHIIQDIKNYFVENKDQLEKDGLEFLKMLIVNPINNLYKVYGHLYTLFDDIKGSRIVSKQQLENLFTIREHEVINAVRLVDLEALGSAKEPYKIRLRKELAQKLFNTLTQIYADKLFNGKLDDAHFEVEKFISQYKNNPQKWIIYYAWICSCRHFFNYELLEPKNCFFFTRIFLKAYNEFKENEIFKNNSVYYTENFFNVFHENSDWNVGNAKSVAEEAGKFFENLNNKHNIKDTFRQYTASVASFYLAIEPQLRTVLSEIFAFKDRLKIPNEDSFDIREVLKAIFPLRAKELLTKNAEKIETLLLSMKSCEKNKKLSNVIKDKILSYVIVEDENAELIGHPDELIPQIRNVRQMAPFRPSLFFTQFSAGCRNVLDLWCSLVM